jgi:predicted MFS family arabinose efflux permease
MTLAAIMPTDKASRLVQLCALENRILENNYHRIQCISTSPATAAISTRDRHSSISYTTPVQIRAMTWLSLLLIFLLHDSNYCPRVEAHSWTDLTSSQKVSALRVPSQTTLSLVPTRDRNLGWKSHGQGWLLSIRGGAKVDKSSSSSAPPRKRQLVPLLSIARKSDKDMQSDQPIVIKSTALASAAASKKKPTPRAPEDPKVMMLIRLLFLTYYASLGSLLPYLPVYYHHLGHGGQIIGLLGAVKPLTTFLVAPAWGLISDALQKPFFIMQMTFLVSLATQLLVGIRHEATYITFMSFVTALFNAPVKSLIDTMVLEHIHDQSSYGKLRLWGQLGFGLGSSGVGIVLSKSPHIPWPERAELSPAWEAWVESVPEVVRQLIHFADKCWRSLTSYKLLFITHALLSIPTWICIETFRRMDLQQKVKEEEQQRREEIEHQQLEQQHQGMRRKSKKTPVVNATVTTTTQSGAKTGASVGDGLWLLLHNADALFFFFLVFVIGVSSGCIENFAYVRMREVGGTGKEMGLSRLVSSIAGAPMFWFSGSLTEALGADRVMILSLLSYIARFFMYAMMRNPLHGLPAEALRGFTFAAFWSTATIYAHRVSPPGLHATMLMFLNAMYGGLGQSVGAIIGGRLQHRYGTVKTFVYSGIADLVVVAFVLAYLSVKPDSGFKDPKPIEAPKPILVTLEEESKKKR